MAHYPVKEGQIGLKKASGRLESYRSSDASISRIPAD